VLWVTERAGEGDSVDTGVYRYCEQEPLEEGHANGQTKIHGERAMNIIITAINPWTLVNAELFSKANDGIVTHIFTRRDELTIETLDRIKPDYVFFPHWSWYIPREVYENYSCVVFHPSDVPFGRGGTPIQNLIAEGHTETVISAIEAARELDAGDVLLKRKLLLLGGGEEIMLRMQKIIFEDMIPFILKNEIVPTKQSGKPTLFRRRTPDMSELKPGMTITQIFDAIRMLDVEGYPRAFINFGDYTLTFSRPALRSDGIEADIKISERRDKNDC
jgi:methionyl-tRNA formyltransferase